jgi:hypothetical protein
VAGINYDPSGLAAGTYAITAIYSGDSSFVGSTSPGQVLTVAAPADFAISVSPTTLIINEPGFAEITTVTITPGEGFSQTIDFSSASCSGLPAGASCSFNPANVTPNGGAVSTTLTVSTAASSASQMMPRQGPPGNRQGMFFALLLPGLLILGGHRGRRGRMLAGLGMIVALLALCVATFSGCGSSGSGGNGGGTPAGTYTITVTATASSLSHSTTFTLVVQ